MVITLDCSPLAPGLRLFVSKRTMLAQAQRDQNFETRLRDARPSAEDFAAGRFRGLLAPGVQRVEAHHRALACCKFKFRVEAQWLAFKIVTIGP